MGVRFPTVATTTILGSVPASGAETIVATTPPLTLPLDSAQVIIAWYAMLTVGTGTTSYQLRLRRGAALTSAVFNVVGNITVTAGNVIVTSGVYVDTPGIVAGQQYSLTLLGNATTGAWATSDVSLLAFVL